MLKDKVKQFKEMDSTDKCVVATTAAYGVAVVGVTLYCVGYFIRAIKK